MGAKSFRSLINCLPEQATKRMPFAISFSMTVMYSGSSIRVPSFNSVPSISVAISLIIVPPESYISLYHDSHLRCLTLLRNYHDQLRRSPIMQACWLSCAHYIISYAVPDLQTVSGNTKQLENAHGYSILYNRKNVLYVPAG